MGANDTGGVDVSVDVGTWVGALTATGLLMIGWIVAGWLAVAGAIAYDVDGVGPVTLVETEGLTDVVDDSAPIFVVG